MFPIYLNDDWRIDYDPLQWILQHKRPNGRWRDRRFLTTRAGLLMHTKELCGERRSDAVALIEHFPDHHRGLGRSEQKRLVDEELVRLAA